MKTRLEVCLLINKYSGFFCVQKIEPDTQPALRKGQPEVTLIVIRDGESLQSGCPRYGRDRDDGRTS